jgi:hypothetical protein
MEHTYRGGREGERERGRERREKSENESDSPSLVIHTLLAAKITF